MEKTDSEIHSFSHWAIMTRAMEKTDSEIHSFSHWAIMTDYQNWYRIIGQVQPYKSPNQKPLLFGGATKL